MRIYLSSPPRWLLDAFAEYWPDKKLDVLRSAASEPEKTIQIAINKPTSIRSLILDSGTWTINNDPKLKKSFKAGHYKEFLWNYSHCFDHYFNFDIDFSENAEIQNWTTLKDLERPFDNDPEHISFHPIPVIQHLKDVDKYCTLGKQYPIIAIGSGAKSTKKELKKAVDKLKSFNIKVHLFASGSYEMLHDIPVWSCDCTSFRVWTDKRIACFFDDTLDKPERMFFLNEQFLPLPQDKEFKYALHDYYNDSGKFEAEKISYLFSNNANVERYNAWLDDRGLGDVTKSSFDQNALLLANARYFQELAEIITEEHKARGFSFDIW